MKYFESYKYFSRNLSTSVVKYEDWYDKNIEPPLGELVKILRNNGFNTFCSCGHDMYIQIQYLPGTDLDMIDKLIYSYLNENKYVITYEITTRISRIRHHESSYIEINFINMSTLSKSPHSSQKFANDSHP